MAVTVHTVKTGDSQLVDKRLQSTENGIVDTALPQRHGRGSCSWTLGKMGGTGQGGSGERIHDLVSPMSH